MNVNYKYIISLVIGVLIGLLFNNSQVITQYKNNYINTIKRDTIIDTLFIKKPPVVIELAPATVTFTRTDTLIKTNPFIASLDTNAKGIDSLKIRFKFPDNKFDFKAYLTQDTIKNKTIRDSVFINQEWYKQPQYVIPATIFGVLLIAKVFTN